jgi:beta-phosphoglucomutase-like phosphatase (HAD superfamily)
MNAGQQCVYFFDIGDTLGRVSVSASGDRIERVEVLPGVLGVLRELRDRGARLGIISNRGGVPAAEVERALTQADLLGFFDPALIIFGRKDSAEIFRRAATAVGRAPGECVFVGENEAERNHATAAGMRVAPAPRAAAEACVTPGSGPPLTGEPLTAADAPASRAREGFDDVVKAIEEHGERLLAIPGVVAVRPSYRFERGRITREPAISVSVLDKRSADSLPEGQLIPARLGGVAVDIVPATPLEQLQYVGEGFGAADGRVETRLPGDASDDDAADAFAPLQPYVPPDEPLDPVDEEMTVVCHASPDAGWRNLREFLAGTDERLTATMYEFTARHILDKLVEAVGGGDRRLSLILDAGHQDVSGNDVTKEEVVDTLGDALGERFRFVWAAVGDDSVTTAAFFKNAYHIKVAVRDGGAFWLSSGNFKRSGQPVTDPIHGPLPANFDPRRFQSSSNREWNVIISSPTLAALMETYITHDIDQAEPLQVAGAAPSLRDPLPDLFVPTSLAESFDPPAAPQFFAERVITKRLRVQPLLTPDNYIDHILPLVEGASEKLYFQNQSLQPNNSNQKYMRLFRALRDKSLDEQIDVRIIVRGDFDPANILATLQAHGFEMSRVRLQNGNHNKGILVDDTFTVVGSHNWTGAGTTTNRDASLIFDDAGVSEYYARLFLYDWDNLARPGDESLLAMPRLAREGDPTPPGAERVPWHEFFAE